LPCARVFDVEESSRGACADELYLSAARFRASERRPTGPLRIRMESRPVTSGERRAIVPFASRRFGYVDHLDKSCAFLTWRHAIAGCNERINQSVPIESSSASVLPGKRGAHSRGITLCWRPSTLGEVARAQATKTPSAVVRTRDKWHAGAPVANALHRRAAPPIAWVARLLTNALLRNHTRNRRRFHSVVLEAALSSSIREPFSLARAVALVRVTEQRDWLSYRRRWRYVAGEDSFGLPVD